MLNQAVVYILSATFLFTALNVCVKYLPHLPTSQVVLFRGLVSLIICYFYLKKMGISPWGQHKKVLILRGIFGTLSLFALFYCLKHMPIAMAMTLSNLAPLFAVLIAHFFLGEESHWSQFVFLIVAFGGVVLVKGWDSSVPWSLAVLGIFGAFMAGCAYTCVRSLRTQDHPLVVVFYFPLLSLPMMIGPAVTQWVSPSLRDWLLLILIGILTQFAQYFMTVAYQLERASKIMIYNYTGLIWAVLVGGLFFGEHFELPQILGLGVVVACLLGSAYVAYKMTPKKAL